MGEYHCIEDDDVALEYTKEEVDECGMSSNMDEVAGLEIERSESKENQSGRIQNMENDEVTNQATCSENNLEDKTEETDDEWETDNNEDEEESPVVKEDMKILSKKQGVGKELDEKDDFKQLSK